MDHRESLERKALPWLALAALVVTLSGLWAADRLSPGYVAAPPPRVLVVIPSS